MNSSCRGLWLVALLVVAATIVGCERQRGAGATSQPSAKSDRGTVVASVEQSRSGDALRLYLHRWMLNYNETSVGGAPSSSDTSWAPEIPDDVVSVIPSVAVSDLNTLAVWSASIQALGPVTETHAAYRADFQFWRGSPLSSAGTGAVALSSSATYDLSWDAGRNAWAITQTSESPDSHLVEPSRETTGFP